MRLVIMIPSLSISAYCIEFFSSLCDAHSGVWVQQRNMEGWEQWEKASCLYNRAHYGGFLGGSFSVFRALHSGGVLWFISVRVGR